MLEPGDEITLTQSSINVEDLIGHMIFSQSGGQLRRRRPAAAPGPSDGQDPAGLGLASQ